MIAPSVGRDNIIFLTNGQVMLRSLERAKIILIVIDDFSAERGKSRRISGVGADFFGANGFLNRE